MDMHAHETLVGNLMRELPDATVVETHISSIILSRDIVYKLKKPVDFGFLDYSTLKKRHHCCLEELRSNRRAAAPLYLGLVTITGSPDVPMIEGEGEVIDYAVKMRRFDENDQLDHVADEGKMTSRTVDTLADLVAGFHGEASAVEANSAYGEPERVLAPMVENFDLLDALLDDETLEGVLADLKVWTLDSFQHLRARIEARKQKGFVRECHGDLHLHNIATFEGELILFDAIEFNPFLSHIDIISDLAFLVMDLEYRGLNTYATRLLNRYLEHTGDYEGAVLLNFYKCYRAMVRAKVAALRLGQHLDPVGAEAVREEVARYVDLARSYTQRRIAFLAITHGYSGSGKSTAALTAARACSGLRIRSDVERQRLFAATRGSAEGDMEAGIYTHEATRITYEHLASLARMLVQSGLSVIVDATFLKRWQRKLFEALAEEGGWNLLILDMACDKELLKTRLKARMLKGSDVSEADLDVLEHQLHSAEPLGDEERRYVAAIDCSSMERMKKDVTGAMA